MNSQNGVWIYDGPFYNGPFPPATPVDCCRRPCGRPYDGARPASAFFYQSGRLNIGGGRPIPFNSCSLPDNAIRLSGGVMTLRRPGAYAVSYAVTVPENATLSTVLRLSMDGGDVPGSALEIVKNTTDNSMTFSGQAIVNAEEDAELKLVSEAPIDIGAGSGSDVVATMSVHRL